MGGAAATDTQPFLQKYCFECHDADTKKAGLNLAALKLDLARVKPNTLGNTRMLLDLG